MVRTNLKTRSLAISWALLLALILAACDGATAPEPAATPVSPVEHGAESESEAAQTLASTPAAEVNSAPEAAASTTDVPDDLVAAFTGSTKNSLESMGVSVPSSFKEMQEAGWVFNQVSDTEWVVTVPSKGPRGKTHLRGLTMRQVSGTWGLISIAMAPSNTMPQSSEFTPPAFTSAGCGSITQQGKEGTSASQSLAVEEIPEQLVVDLVEYLETRTTGRGGSVYMEHAPKSLQEMKDVGWIFAQIRTSPPAYVITGLVPMTLRPNDKVGYWWQWKITANCVGEGVNQTWHINSQEAKNFRAEKRFAIPDPLAPKTDEEILRHTAEDLNWLLTTGGASFYNRPGTVRWNPHPEVLTIAVPASLAEMQAAGWEFRRVEESIYSITALVPMENKTTSEDPFDYVFEKWRFTYKRQDDGNWCWADSAIVVE